MHNTEYQKQTLKYKNQGERTEIIKRKFHKSLYSLSPDDPYKLKYRIKTQDMKIYLADGFSKLLHLK